MLDNGNVWGGDEKDIYAGFKELDWKSNVVWEYYEKRENYYPHHDQLRIYNPKLKANTTLFIANKDLTYEEVIAAGADPNAAESYDGSQMDAIVEVDMDGNVVWEWWFFDHLIQDFDPTKKNYVGKGKRIEDYPGKLDINWGKPVARDWMHCNSLDFNQELDQIVINSVQGEFYIIDHGNTFILDDPEGSIKLAAGDAGDFPYRFGDPARYGQGEPASVLGDWTRSTNGTKQIGGSHDIQWIRPGLPGAGNFLVFNNAQYLFEKTPQSYIFEINGFLNSDKKDTGKYVNPPDAGYYVWEIDQESMKITHKQPRNISGQVVWIYSSKSNTGFFSHIGSGCQRLPNGNTLICATTEGHIFEVTHNGEVVWEYINPVTRDGDILDVIPDSYPMTNSVFRAYRYGPDHPAVAGKDLAPKGKITELAARGEL